MSFACALACDAGTDDSAGAVAPCEELQWTSEPALRSLVLIVNDTTRRDRVGTYGGPARTPALDALAATGLVFDRATSQSPWTKPSIATLFTGLRPKQHAVTLHPASRDRAKPLETDRLGPELTTLAEILQRAGYRTAAFVSNPWLKQRFGFAQGFEVYDDSFAANDTPGSTITRAGLAWLDRVEGPGPFFLYLHYMDSHGPWVLSDEDIAAHLQRAVENDRPLSHLAERTIRQMVRRADGHPVAGPDLPATRALLELAYRRGIEQFDNSLGALMHGIAQRDVARDAAVIVTADHGEALFERAWGLHGDGLFEDELGVPLVARLPGVVAAGRIDCPVGLMDIVPTLCTYLGLDCAPATGGTSIIAAGSGPSRRSRYIVSEAVVGKPRHRAIRNQRYKLIWEPAGRPKTPDHTRAYALFDLRDDAREQTDLLDPAHLTDEAERIFVTLRDALDAMDRATVVRPAGRVPLDAATQKRLESLGYLDR